MYIIFGRRAAAAVLSSAILICAAAAASGGIVSTTSAPASASVSWGLSFSDDGCTPSGSKSSDELNKLGAVYTGDTEQKRIYITFDAGYENGNTGHILDVLKKHDATAAFFLVGNYFRTSPELVKRMAKEGHIVANHTMNHPDMSQITDENAFSEELKQLEELCSETIGRLPDKFYRPPQGKFTEENLRTAKALGYTTVLWSLAYADWDNDSQPTKEQAFSNLIPRIHNGAIVLLHSTSATNSEILDELLTKWEDMGYSFGSLEELKQ